MSEADDGIQEMFPPRVGDLLRAAREAQGLSIEEIAGRTRVPSRHLATIEAGDLSRLPAAPYSAGFIKSYARVVGLNEAELSRAFRDELAAYGDERADSMPFAPADPSRVAPRGLAWVAAIVAVALVIGYLVWRNTWSGDGPDTREQLAAQTAPPPEAAPAPAPAAPPPAPAVVPIDPAAPAAPAAAPGGPVVLTATAPVWVRIYNRDGNKTLFMAEMAAGQRYEVPASAADPLIRTGRAESIRVTVGGAEAPRLGPPDTTLADVSLRPEALLGGAPAGAEPPARKRPRRPAAAAGEPTGAAGNSAAPVIPALPAAGPTAVTRP